MDYPGQCVQAEVQRCIKAVQHNCILRGVCDTVVRNATQGGFTPYLELNAKRVEINNFFEGSEIHDRFTPVIAQIFRDVLAVGYTCVVVDPDAEDPDDRLFVVDLELYDLRWVISDMRRVYVAVPSDASLSTESPLTMDGISKTTIYSLNTLNDKKIKNSFPYVMNPPDHRSGSLTSPVSQTLSYVAQLEQILTTYMSVIASQARPPIFTEAAAASLSGDQAEIPFMLTALEPETGLNLRKITIPGGGDVARNLRAAQAIAEQGRYGDPAEARQQQLADTAASVGTTIVYNGRPVADVSPGRTLARDPTAPTMDMAAAIHMIETLTILIGRAFGISAEHLLGGGGSSSKLIAGVEASRRQLAVTIENLQLGVAKFLQRVFARFYFDLLCEVIAGSRPMRETKQAGEPTRITLKPSGKRSKGGGRESSEDDDDGDEVKVDAAAAAKVEKARKKEDLPRITISFNKIPFLEYDTLRKCVLDGVVSPVGFRDTIGRMYHIHQSEMTTSYDNGPQELLLDSIIEDLKLKRSQRKQVDAQVVLQKEQAAVISTTGGTPAAAAKSQTPRQRVSAENAHSRAHEAGEPSVGEGTKPRRSKV